jgi:hypothetical protein
MRINYEGMTYMNLKKLVILLVLIGIVAGAAFAQNRLETGMYKSSNSSAGWVYIGWSNTPGNIQVRFHDTNLRVIGDYSASVSGRSLMVSGGAYRFDIIDSRTFRFQGATYSFH